MLRVFLDAAVAYNPVIRLLVGQLSTIRFFAVRSHTALHRATLWQDPCRRRMAITPRANTLIHKHLRDNRVCPTNFVTSYSLTEYNFVEKKCELFLLKFYLGCLSKLSIYLNTHISLMNFDLY